MERVGLKFSFTTQSVGQIHAENEAIELNLSYAKRNPNRVNARNCKIYIFVFLFGPEEGNEMLQMIVREYSCVHYMRLENRKSKK